MNFTGRKQELNQLEHLYDRNSSALVALYGRRRIGKSELIKHFCTGKKALLFEALERQPSRKQITHFTQQLKIQLSDPLLDHLDFKTWEAVFEFLTHYIKAKNQKLIIFFDEYPWMAAGRSHLTALLKFYWDNHWKDASVLLVLCGSVSSYMVKKVIRSKALYGRFSLELQLDEFSPIEAYHLLKGKRSYHETLQYLMVLGGIPKYLAEINPQRSFEQNINEMMFTRNGLLTQEIERIFFSQFKEPKTYKKIIQALSRGPLSLEELSQKLKIPSGGGLASYLENLELGGFVRTHAPFQKELNTKFKKYKLTDAYLIFYFKYIEPHQRLIQTNRSANLFKRLIKPAWKPWTGIAFENLCLKYQSHLAKAMGFEDEVLKAGPFWENRKPGYQIDLIYQRTDQVFTLCEIKYSDQPLTAEIIAEVERKCQLFPLPRNYTLERAIICPAGVSPEVKKSEYFQHIVTLEHLFRE